MEAAIFSERKFDTGAPRTAVVHGMRNLEHSVPGVVMGDSGVLCASERPRSARCGLLLMLPQGYVRIM